MLSASCHVCDVDAWMCGWLDGVCVCCRVVCPHGSPGSRALSWFGGLEGPGRTASSPQQVRVPCRKEAAVWGGVFGQVGETEQVFIGCRGSASGSLEVDAAAWESTAVGQPSTSFLVASVGVGVTVRAQFQASTQFLCRISSRCRRGAPESREPASVHRTWPSKSLRHVSSSAQQPAATSSYVQPAQKLWDTTRVFSV